MYEDDNKINLIKNEESSVKDLKVALEQSIQETSEIIESLIHTIELKIEDEDIRKSTKLKIGSIFSDFEKTIKIAGIKINQNYDSKNLTSEEE
ncbi:MAG: hypothetical protein CMD32_02785 [Flavobacteriales bacterium]|jgi:hypothetical protein|nr:hypothetical protein [Flavobacteriales bacterium]|tara:strand:+ start:4452 stop:4730 length:279 start_codon:yes stop_codon:yes gene_type:complete